MARNVLTSQEESIGGEVVVINMLVYQIAKV